MTPDAVRRDLSAKGINPDTYVGEDGQEYYFTLSGGQMQWIYHQEGIESPFDVTPYLSDRMYIYNVDLIQKIQNAQMFDGNPVLHQVLCGPLTKTTESRVEINGILYDLYTWHEVVSIDYPWVEFIEYTTRNGKIQSYKIIGGPYDARTIPSYEPYA
jgi:hypothetical protein